MLALTKRLKEAAKAFVFKHTKFAAPSYRYNVEPIQLAFLINQIEQTKDKTGSVVEIGVARGMTTRFLCQHIVNQKLQESCTLYAIDTFESFTKDDLEYEVKERGKLLFDLEAFNYNDFDVWRKNFHQFPFLKVIKADCSLVDYEALGPIKLAFLDVDLYLPTKNVLPKLYNSLIDGGAIVVDDVLNNNTYDGAYQAYMEFCEDQKITPKIIGNKCGIIVKNIVACK